MAIDKVKVLDKALSILTLICANEELSLKELEEFSGLNRTTVYRILQSFLNWGYVEQNLANKKYRASLKILEMAGIVLQRMDVVKVARPYLLSLRDESKESTYVAVLNGFNVVYADWEPSYYDAHITGSVGRSIPAYCTGAGKTILAYLPKEEVNKLLEKHELKRYTQNTITDKDKLKQDLEKTLTRGYGISIEEFGSDAIAVAAPIFDIKNKIIASIAVAALKSRVKGDEHIKNLGGMVKKFASNISKELGSTFYK